MAFSEKNWNRQFKPLNWGSDGITNVIILLTILLNKNKPKLIILDEFENGLHPELRKQLLEFIKAAADDTQLIILTHDSNLLSDFELEDIFYFRREGAHSSIEPVSNINAITKTRGIFDDPEKKSLILAHSTKTL